MNRIAVVSTGLNSPHRDRCMRSVYDQKTPHEHHYIEAGDQGPNPPNALENRYHLIHTLDPDVIVCEVDGDDVLAPGALEIVAKAYEDPKVWLTYGSFVFLGDGREGFCAKYARGESYRLSPWRASHLKTFRAGLFHKIVRGDFVGPKGEPFSPHVHDMFSSVPMLEMAGPDHVKFISDVTYAYDLASSFEWNATPSQLEYEQTCKTFLRNKAPYKRVDSWA